MFLKNFDSDLDNGNFSTEKIDFLVQFQKVQKRQGAFLKIENIGSGKYWSEKNWKILELENIGVGAKIF